MLQLIEYALADAVTGRMKAFLPTDALLFLCV
jgi:hypothetical protein